MRACLGGSLRSKHFDSAQVRGQCCNETERTRLETFAMQGTEIRDSYNILTPINNYLQQFRFY